LNHKKSDIYVSKILPLISEWIPDDQVISDDRKKVKETDRNIICGI
jgi:hypothetical protein